MYLRCESIGHRFLPILRCHVAKELIEKYGLTQIEVAKKLGTTQAAISQYLHLKRGATSLKKFKETLPIIQSAASEIASEIASGKIDVEKIALRFCEVCTSIQKTVSRK